MELNLKMKNAIKATVISLALLSSATIVAAQEISDAHLAKAKAAIAATQATESFDSILPQAAQRLKNNMTNANPDKVDQIDAVIDEEAIALAARRGVLENEAAKLFATTFSEQELDTMTEFFSSKTGQKYLSSTPILARELAKAARVWGAGIQRDLAESADKKLREMDN